MENWGVEKDSGGGKRKIPKLCSLLLSLLLNGEKFIERGEEVEDK
jgi:hypothetical protein